MNRMPIPPVIQRSPECPLCSGDLNYEEGWVCEPCQVFWPDSPYDPEGSTSDWGDEVLPQCPAETEPIDAEKYPSLAGRRYRCVRQEGHDADPDTSSWSYRDHEGIRVDGEAPSVNSTWSWSTKE